MNITFQRAFLASFGCLIAFFITNANLFAEPFWALITVCVLCGDNHTHPFIKGFLRIIGTVGGALLGLIFFANISSPFYTLFFTFIVITLINYHVHQSKHAYAWMLGGVTFFIVVAVGSVKPDLALYIGFARSIEIITGVLICMVLFCFFKEPPHELSKRTMAKDKQIMLSIKVGICGILTWLLWIYSGWYDGIVGLITAQVVEAQITHKTLYIKATHRFLGCFIGGILGLLNLIVVPQSLFNTCYILTIIVFIFTYLQNRFLKYSYMYLQAVVAYILVIVPSSNQFSLNIEPALERLAGILIGIIGALIVNLFIWPKAHSEEKDVFNKLAPKG